MSDSSKVTRSDSNSTSSDSNMSFADSSLKSSGSSEASRGDSPASSDFNMNSLDYGVKSSGSSEIFQDSSSESPGSDKSAFPYTAFARKYRPRDFSELLGQDFLTKTLSYCISEDRLSQAYLLSGIRGVGKTSTARIIAKTINCTDPVKGRYVTPCNGCNNCQSVNKNNHPDVIEIDAASHTSVDDVKLIINSSEYMPLLGRYKIFIIDEVHMLSRNAFNALLKIVEEPPKHVIFVFATTEIQKIPITVISRCQRFDLKRLSFDEISFMLKGIAEKENIKITDTAIRIIANNSDGSARDATAILDQVFSCAMNSPDNNHQIDDKLVSNMLGRMQLSFIIKIVQLIVCHDTESALAILKKVYIDSANLEIFIADIADFIAELTKQKLIKEYKNPLYSSYYKEITDLLIGMSVPKLSSLWQIFSAGIKEVTSSHNQLLASEMVIIKAIHICSLPSIDKILRAEKYVSNNISKSNISHNSDNFDTQKNVEKNGSESLENDISKEKQINSHFEQNLDKICDFFKYCYKSGEINLYYYLFNNTQISKFTDTELILLSNKVEKGIKDKLLELINSWSGKKYEVTIKETQESLQSLKDYIIRQVKDSEDFNIIKIKFPTVSISDILLG